MDFFFCLPLVFGCPEKIKPEGDQTPRLCPRCHNAAVIRAKSRTWFELCFIPLIPMSKKHLWMCTICQWNIPVGQGWEPQVPMYGYQHPGQAPWGGSPAQVQSPPGQPSWGGYPSPPANSYQQGPKA